MVLLFLSSGCALELVAVTTFTEQAAKAEVVKPQATTPRRATGELPLPRPGFRPHFSYVSLHLEPEVVAAVPQLRVWG